MKLNEPILYTKNEHNNTTFILHKTQNIKMNNTDVGYTLWQFNKYTSFLILYRLLYCSFYFDLWQDKCIIIHNLCAINAETRGSFF